MVDDSIAARLEQATAHICAGRLIEATEAVKEVLAADPDQPLARRYEVFLRKRLEPELGLGTEPDASSPPSSEDRFDADEWDAVTTAAIDVANLLDTGDERFPLVADNDQDFETPVRTVAVGGVGVALAFNELATISPLLARLSAEHRNELLSSCEIVQCFAGQIVSRQGADTSTMYLVITGEVAVERTTDSGTHRLATAVPGDFFGECALLGKTGHTMTARVLDDAMLLEVTLEMIKKFVADQPDVLTVLTLSLRARLVSTLRRESPVYRTLPDRAFASLSSRLHLHNATEGQVLLTCGRASSGLWTVMAGELERREGGNAKRLASPESFGRHFLDGGLSNADIVAVSPCWLLRLPSDSLGEADPTRAELIAALAVAAVAS